MRYFILFFLIFCTDAYAQTWQVKSKADHPYRHVPSDINADNTPSDGDCLTYSGSNKLFHWATCGSATTAFLLLEDSSFILLEDGTSKIILE